MLKLHKPGGGRHLKSKVVLISAVTTSKSPLCCEQADTVNNCYSISCTTTTQSFLGWLGGWVGVGWGGPNILLRTIRRDCRSTTGSNLRNILLMTRKDNISELVPEDVSQMEYKPVTADEDLTFISNLKDINNKL